MPIIGYSVAGTLGIHGKIDHWVVAQWIDDETLGGVNGTLGNGYLLCSTSAIPGAAQARMYVYEKGVTDALSPLVASSNIVSVPNNTDWTWIQFTFSSITLEAGKTYVVAFATKKDTSGGFPYTTIALKFDGGADTYRDINNGSFNAPVTLSGFGAPVHVTRYSVYAEYTTTVPTTETVTIQSDAYIVNPHIFTFANPVGVTTSISRDRPNLNVFDIQLKHACNHKLSGGQFTLNTCSRCLGTGYYYDARFNEMGRLIEISLENKLQQALEKLVLTEENKFHKDIAIGLKKWLGETSILKIQAIIKHDLVTGIAVLKDNQKNISGLSSRAKIATIDDIVITVSDIDTLHYTVTVTTVSGETSNLIGIVNIEPI